MSSRKFRNKEERFKLVKRFLESGQSHTVWCQENGIKSNTLYRWRLEYTKSIQKDVCFVPLKPQASKKVNPTSTQNSSKDVLLELGTCKVHIPEHIAVPLLTQILKETVNAHV